MIKFSIRSKNTDRPINYAKIVGQIAAIATLSAAPDSYAARDAGQLIAQQTENQAVALRAKNHQEKDQSPECSIKGLHLPLDHGPRAATTVYENRKKIEECNAAKSQRTN